MISESYKEIIDNKYFQFAKNNNAGKGEEEKGGVSMIRHEAKSCFNLIIPFLFVQLACEDLYYLLIMKKFWGELMRNPYIFRPKLKPA